MKVYIYSPKGNLPITLIAPTPIWKEFGENTLLCDSNPTHEFILQLPQSKIDELKMLNFKNVKWSIFRCIESSEIVQTR